MQGLLMSENIDPWLLFFQSANYYYLDNFNKVCVREYWSISLTIIFSIYYYLD